MNINCPYCNADNDGKDLSQKDRTLLYCFNCDEEIGEVIPKIFFFYESFYFLFNIFIFVFIIGTSFYFFENYTEWKFAAGFTFLFTLTLASIALHEFFHAFFAFNFGDYTVFSKKYLRLNIFKYIDNFGSFFFPLIVFFFSGIFSPGAAVFINENNIRYRVFHFIVNISGIFSQVIFLLGILFILNSYNNFLSNDFIILLHTAAFFQILILVFNLLPIPGLDGWNAIFSLLSKDIGNSISNFLSYPLIIGFVACLIFIDDFNLWFFSNLFLLGNIFGLNKNLILEGYSYLKIIDINTLLLFKERIFDLITKIIT